MITNIDIESQISAAQYLPKNNLLKKIKSPRSLINFGAGKIRGKAVEITAYFSLQFL
ncbi:MAG: hypothetical protein V7K14_10395 [Nostoc sp.]|uniref:hypothetical protein n=1 Tax=Nostoc sp. NMS7 TaxID=2815391 RepID=UPI0025E1159E|nr:hypothetical protein [Nostoc sp. NMS7]MBN3946172.1 hypothetical protein [Nostoc sp. NMS7]